MKLQDKHREFAVKCYAKFMNTNATIVFKLINYGREARKPRQIIQNTINVFYQAHLAFPGTEAFNCHFKLL